MPSSPAADRGLRAEALRRRLARDEAADLEDARRAALDAERDAARVAAVADAGLAAAQRTRLAAHVLSTRTRVADALAAASAPGELVRACLRAERTGHPRDGPTRRALRSVVLASGALYVTRSSLGLDPDDRDDERRHVALVAGSFDGATGAYLGPALLCSRDGGDGDGPGDGGEYLLDGAALDVYAREDRCCFDVRVDGVPPLELAAAGAAERDAGGRRARRARGAPRRARRERAFGTPKSGDRAVPSGRRSTAKKRRPRRRRAAVAEAGSFTLVADALVATYKSDAAAWPPRALVDAVSAAPPLIRGPLAVRLEVHGEWTACDDAKLYGVTFQGDALAGPMLRVRGEFLPLRDCRVDEAPPATTLLAVHAKTPRLLLRAVSLKRRTVDRAEARGVARDLFATRGAEVRA
ncbi:hypothetical protein JL720_12869 [Aureococcus anophagefferens]|nr:hypothetical protein JL720_12869 [Aureococcus anophagefferens]